jgi:hypothetical protein
MRLRISGFPILLLLAVMALSACASLFSKEKSLPAAHPEELGEKRVLCSECHEEQAKGTLLPLTTFNHTPTFINEHRLYAVNSDKLCTTCHAVSFCNDCHATKNEVKPSTKLGNRPDRELMHRGDYLTRHRIDGKVDPAGCYRCHGRFNNEQCHTCHR